MRLIQLKSRVSSNGTLNLAIPIGMAGEEVEVLVVIQPQERESGTPEEERDWPPRFFETTYGSLAADPIERPHQGEHEICEPIA